MARAARSDVHRPSFADPADYTEVGYFDNHPEEGGGWTDPAYSRYDWFSGNYELRGGRCDHCGAGPLRYVVVFFHAPTERKVCVGERCASKLGLASKSAAEHRKMVERARLDAKRAAFEAAHPKVAAFLADARNSGEERFEFVLDIAAKQLRYGDLSENQVAAIERIMVKRAEQKAEREANAPPDPLVEGRREVVGTVVSTKLADGFYGEQWKMLVEQDDGNRVFGTIPEILFQLDVEHMKGTRLSFMAAVERSKKDDHFGFFKRPTRTTILEEAS